MIKRILICLLFACAFISTIAHATPEYRVVDDGVLIYPDKRFSGNADLVRLQVMSAGIIRVIASPVKELSATPSLMVIATPAKVKFDVKEADGYITLTTDRLSVKANLLTGAVAFAGKNGKALLNEREYGGRSLTPAVFDGQPLFGIKQVFDIVHDDAIYGLGQHQDDIFNYRGRQVIFFQNNTEVAIPFLVSARNYGILWDNYSFSKIGDTRDFQPLSTLQLRDEDGEHGWLTASYSNERDKPGDIILKKAESEISYPYVGDSKMRLPTEFKPERGVVNWNGTIASAINGEHQLRFTYAGYIKLWIDDKLLLEKWRQAWNPGTAVIPLQLEKEKEYKIRIEWIPDGGESYITAGWLPPLPAIEANTFGFASEAGRQVDYYFVYGDNLDEVIAGYRSLTGKAPIVPKWAMGFWQSRERYKTQDELLGAVKEFRKRKIPLDNIVLDWSYWKQDEWGSQEFDEARFPDPEAMIRSLHQQYRTRIMISVWPKFYEGIATYRQFDEKGWLYKRNIADRQRDWIAHGYVSTFYDAFNEGARKGFWELIHDRLYKKGFDAWWMDASEPDILSNVSPGRRKQQMTPTAIGTAAEYLNAYPLQNAKGIYDGQRGVDPNKRVFLLTRSGYGGSQRYAATIWSGDIASRWEDMKTQITAGINFSLSGLPYWTMDIGGFSVERRYEQPNETDLAEWRELQTRWYQFGAFVPLFRAHGQYPFREIYNIAPETHPAYASMLYYNRLRYRLMPYIYTLAGEAWHRDGTIMRGLVMDFPQDTVVRRIGDQYLFGPSLLINPVYQYRAVNRSVYLPAGNGWYDLYTGRYHAGGQHIIANAPYERMPLFVREGSIIPTGPELQFTDEKPADPITLYVYGGRDAEFNLYEDENLNYNYEKGDFATIAIHYDATKNELIIGERKGSFHGMLQARTFYVKLIDQKHPAGIGFAPEGRKIRYSGKRIVVRL